MKQDPAAKSVPAFRRPPGPPSGPARVLDAWLLQHYALVVWLTTGVRKRRPPLPFAQLAAGFRTFISGQLALLFNALLLWLTGRKLSDGAFCLLNGLFLLSLLAYLLPLLEKRTLHRSIPARFRQLGEGHRRRLAWTCFVLFWAAFGSLFFVGASLK